MLGRIERALLARMYQRSTWAGIAWRLGLEVSLW